MADDTRFWDRVTRTDECWEWSGAVNEDGYGVVKRRPKQWLAHVYAYRLTLGEVPDGLELDHTCRNRRCVRPSHLEPVTHRVNVLRAQQAKGIRAFATACPKGHEYAGDNVRVDRRGWRVCVACKRIADAASARRLRAERKTHV